MKKIVFRLISSLLIVSVPFCSLSAYAASSLSYQTVPCISNLCDMESIEILLRDNKPCISVSDAAELSGYERSGAYFVRSNERIKPECFVYNNVEWMMMENGLEALNTEVVKIGNALVFRGLETTAEECFSKTDEIMIDFNSAYRVVDTQGYAGALGYAAASIYNIISQGKFYSRISGNYSEELYKEVIAEMVKDSEDSELLSLFSESNSLIGKLDTLGAIEGMTEVVEDGEWKIITNGATSDSLAAIHALNKTMDPLGEMFESLGLGNEMKFGDFFSLKGLDVVSQLKLYQYFDSLIGCGELYSNMFSYTYGKSKIASEEYVPEAAVGAISDLTAYYNSDDYLKLLTGYISAEGELVWVSSVDDLMDGFLTESLLSSSGALVVPIAQFALRESYDLLFDDVSDKMDFIEKSRCITELQSGIMKLYREYRKSPETAINAKYAAMLYVRCAQINYKLSVGAGVIDESSAIGTLYSNALIHLAAILDRDLTVTVSNNNIVLSEEDTDFDDRGWYAMTVAERVWMGAERMEQLLSQDENVWSARVLINEGTHFDVGEGGAIEWSIGNNYGSLLSVNDEWVGDHGLILDVSLTEYTMSIKITPQVAFDFEYKWDNWWGSLCWVYAWDGTLIHSDTDLDFADGLFYAMEQSG